MPKHGGPIAVARSTDQGRRLAEATMKHLTGGDKNKARYLFKDLIE